MSDPQVPLLHLGQLGVSDLFILNRMMLSGRCPIHIWISALAWLHFSWSAMWMKLSDGTEQSLFVAIMCRGTLSIHLSISA